MLELLDLIARWVHVVAGIMWVGNSLLFNWLDRSLRPGRDDVYGDIWLIHSGGFYFVEKNKGERRADGSRALPRPLHWFKWQAYTTWLSGAALLFIVYYVGGRALIVDPAVADIAPLIGSAIAFTTLIATWLLYEGAWRTIGRRSAALASFATIAVLGAGIWVFLNFLSGRAAFLHVGAMLGTLMAGNVAFTIMPSQRELVTALRDGREPSQVIADRAKQRSIHNNYFTFPVIALMLSAHFPALYAQRGSLLGLLIVIAAGAAVRHALNSRFTYARWRLSLAGALIASIAALAILFLANPFAPSAQRQTVAFTAAPTDAEAHRIIDRRCASCHSAAPADISLGAMPAGVAFDTPAQINLLKDRILERAVTTRTMPPANKTRMTDAERDALAAWIASQP